MSHTAAGFRAAFEQEHKRKPTEQEMWNHAIPFVARPESPSQCGMADKGLTAIARLDRAMAGLQGKPHEPLKPRGVRMSDTQWEAFLHLGGEVWLRSRIDKLNLTGIARRQRNNRMRAMAARGETIEAIAEFFNVSTATARRAIE